MDRAMSSVELATALGTSLPRLHRAVRRGMVRPVPGPSRRLRFHPGAVAELRSRWGWVPAAGAAGLAREDLLVLAALSRHPLGLRSVRAVARAAGISPTTAARSLRRLTDRGVATRRRVLVTERTARELEVWTVVWRAPAWHRVAATVGQVVLPQVRSPMDRSGGVPSRLWHLFWDTDPRRLRVGRHGPYIVERMLRLNDLPALAWMSRAIPPDTILLAAGRRGLGPRERSLARVIAGSGQVERE